MNNGIKAVIFLLTVSGVVIVGSVVYRVNKDTPEVAQQADPVPSSAASGSPIAAAKVRSGDFTKIDAVHQGSGQAVIYQQGETAYLKFENFTVNDGPDLLVYLSKNANIEHDRKSGEFVSLGKLKALTGEQTYSLPSDWADYQAVTVWCRAFNVPFTVTKLEAV